MEQVYNPNLSILAVAGWCLKYVDDAGNAPNRNGTAKAAYYNEKNTGRIRLDDTPDGVWVVGFLDFTKGKYTREGHVFFIKRSGASYEIYDSEVQSGSRYIVKNGQRLYLGPYKSINELLSWFGVYDPVYLGWSTHCDGREYAKYKSNKELTMTPEVAAALDDLKKWIVDTNSKVTYVLEQNNDLKNWELDTNNKVSEELKKS